MQLGQRIEYRTERGWSGRRYYVRMSQAEIRARDLRRLIAGIVIGTPVWVIIMAVAAGLIK